MNGGIEAGVAEAYVDLRPLLFSIGYRMLGSAADAEDLVQDAYVRFASSDRDAVRDAKAFLVTVLTRLALDKLKSAQAQREQYVGIWMPEPVFTSREGDAYARVTREQQIERALLAALERLSPQERAVLLLYDVLDYDHNEIAEMLGISAAASRQLLHRGRERVAEEKQRFRPSREEQERLLGGFMAALRNGDVDGLRQVLTDDVFARADHGGKVRGAAHGLDGFTQVSKFFAGWVKYAPEGFRMWLDEVNGETAIVTAVGESLIGITFFDYAEGKIGALRTIVNPDKLSFAQHQMTT